MLLCIGDSGRRCVFTDRRNSVLHRAFRLIHFALADRFAVREAPAVGVGGQAASGLERAVDPNDDDETDVAWDTLPRGTRGTFIIQRFGGEPPLRESTVDTPKPEDDLFAGVRERVPRSEATRRVRVVRSPQYCAPSRMTAAATIRS